MGAYYRHVRNIESYSDLVMEQCPRAVSRRKEPRAGFAWSTTVSVVVGDHLEIPHVQHLREHPVRLLGAFVASQENDVSLSRMARRMIRENLDLIDEGYRRSDDCREMFLKILAGENRVMRTLVTMNGGGFARSIRS